MMKDKIVTADEAIALIRNGDSVSCSGFVGIGTPEELFAALERRLIATQSPRDLTLVFAAAPGDGKDRGLNRLAHEGLIARAIGGTGHSSPSSQSSQSTVAFKRTTCHSGPFLICTAMSLLTALVRCHEWASVLSWILVKAAENQRAHHRGSG